MTRPFISALSGRAKAAVRRAFGLVGLEVHQRGVPSRHRLDSLDPTEFASGIGDSAWLLYGLVRAMKPKVCVEIGSARGKSACFVGAALRDNGGGTLYAIDPHARTDWNDLDSVDSYETMRRNLQRVGVDGFVRIVRETSAAAVRTWELPIDLLFIDGDHSYEGARADWDAFSPFVARFGTVVFHDTLWDLAPGSPLYRPDMGVPRVVDELRREGYPVLTFSRDYGVSLVQPVRYGIALRHG